MKEFNKKELEALNKIDNIQSGIIIAELGGSEEYFIVYEGDIRICDDRIFSMFNQHMDPKEIKDKIKVLYDIEYKKNENKIWKTSERFIEVIGYDKLNTIKIVLK